MDKELLGNIDKLARVLAQVGHDLEVKIHRNMMDLGTDLGPLEKKVIRQTILESLVNLVRERLFKA